ncbi:reticulocalbin-2-like protein [Plakobranchus ocellatus]|uniref:Reticulocalbin-2-like protein n=1 Tax=Plakobranchus ocellatus TaxID=259542 RepID=A0AAV4DEG2_9GAST|nr:reticulocalbin-2-like protein [Plakobranchus ocellatus]
MSTMVHFHCFHILMVLLCGLTLIHGVPETHHHGAHKTDHFKDGKHNPVFDQEALLGTRKVDDVADLDTDVRLRRLRILAKSHDTNTNGIIEKNELKAWVMESFRMLDREEAMEKFGEDDDNADGKVTLDELFEKQYGYTAAELAQRKSGTFKKTAAGDDDEDDDDDDEETFELMKDDEARFHAADLDKDGSLDENEYLAFSQPYDYPHMFEVEMARSMKEFDKDKDGFVSMEEFIGQSGVEQDEESRLSSVTNFEDLDLDKDGKLTSEEMRPYSVPDNNEVAVEEAEHLINMCDEDNDGKLSIEEIVTKEDEFMGSSVTDYGQNLRYVKDEL